MTGQNRENQNKGRKKFFIFWWFLFTTIAAIGLIYYYNFWREKEDVPVIEIGIEHQEEVPEKNEIFEFKIYVDTRGEDVNAVDVSVSYNPEEILVEEIIREESALRYFVDDFTYFDNQTGKINVAGGRPNPGFRGRGNIITVKAKKINGAEKADIIISEDSKVAINDGEGTIAESVIINSEIISK